MFCTVSGSHAPHDASVFSIDYGRAYIPMRYQYVCIMIISGDGLFRISWQATIFWGRCERISLFEDNLMTPDAIVLIDSFPSSRDLSVRQKSQLVRDSKMKQLLGLGNKSIMFMARRLGMICGMCMWSVDYSPVTSYALENCSRRFWYSFAVFSQIKFLRFW